MFRPVLMCSYPCARFKRWGLSVVWETSDWSSQLLVRVFPSLPPSWPCIRWRGNSRTIAGFSTPPMSWTLVRIGQPCNYKILIGNWQTFCLKVCSSYSSLYSLLRSKGVYCEQTLAKRGLGTLQRRYLYDLKKSQIKKLLYFQIYGSVCSWRSIACFNRGK